LEPNDTQPGGPPIRTVTIRLTRDTLILIAALAFLMVAILLAVIFPGRSPAPTGATSTSVAARETAEPTRAGETAVPTAIAVGGAPTAGSASMATEEPAQPQGGYPAPDATSAPEHEGEPTDAASGAEQVLTQTPPAVGAAASPIPPFDPLRPTEPSTGTPGEFTAQATAFPEPSAGAETPEADDLDATSAPIAQPTDVGAGGRSSGAVTPVVSSTPPAVAQPPATSQPAGAAPRAQARPQPTARPTEPPVDVLRGNVRWTAAQSPIVVRRDLHLVAGATLLIEPGVEVRLAPGASFFVDGTLYAIGAADRRVRFVSVNQQRWEGIFGRPGSNIAIENAEIRGGGNGGTVLLSEGGNLVLHHTRVTENGGHIQVSDSRLEVRDSEIAGNDMPYGSAIEASYTSGNGVVLTNNRIGGNRLQPGASPL